MKRLILFCLTLLMLLLAACATQPSTEASVNEGIAPTSPEEAVEAGDSPIVTVYRAPT